MIGEVISITGEKVVDDGLHERLFTQGKDNNTPYREQGIYRDWICDAQ
jgi:hypothetical protein